jgi:para-nitrobenzyl esterase
MPRYVSIAVAVLASAVGVAARAETADTPTPSAAQLALNVLTAKTNAGLTVSSPAFANGGDIPFENTRYRDNRFPGLAWSTGPHGTLSYAIIMQDPDSSFGGAIILHWTAFNIPAVVTRLDAGMTRPPEGASNGPNIRGPNQPYMGPHTPAGPKHHYHFQIFALNAVLPPQAAGSYDALITAMKGHVLAEGDLIGLAEADPNATP